MERTFYHEILSIDSIYNVLSWFDRCYLHLCIMNKEGDMESSEKLQKLAGIVKNQNWKSPETKYGQDRLQYYQQKNEWIELDKYSEAHPELTYKIEQLKEKL